MRKATAFLSIVLFSTLITSGAVISVNANPNWRPWENAYNAPVITVISPVENQSCTSNKVILKFTVTKPTDWFDANIQMKRVVYSVDEFFNGVSDDENVTIVEVNDPLDVENPTTSFSFAFNITGLTDGPHWLDILAEGSVGGLTIGKSQRIDFSVYTPEVEPQTDSFLPIIITASVITVAIVCAGLVYFKKHKKLEPN
jgi:hypothetical protein